MADPLSVAIKRAYAEKRLNAASEAAEAAFGVALRRTTTPVNRYPELAAAEQLECVAEFVENLTKAAAPKAAGVSK